MTSNKMDNPIALIGMGLSGQSAHALLQARGIPNNKLVTFDKDPSLGEFQCEKKMLQKANPRTLIVSPGIPLSTPWIQTFAKQEGHHISSELSLALEDISDEKIIGVTGSLGKSTVVSLLGAGLETSRLPYCMGGNIGIPLGDYALALRKKKRERAQWIVLELSSFQLENSKGLECDYGVFTYFAPNHLERYKDLNVYYACKWSLTRHTKKKMFGNARGGDLKKYAQNHISIPFVWSKEDTFTQEEWKHAKLLGKHGKDNLALASTIAKNCGWPESYKKGMLDFSGLPHRMENVGQYKNISFINDSKSTTIQSIRTAVESLGQEQGKKTILLLGGRDKNLPWEELQYLHSLPNLYCVFFGESAQKIKTRTGMEGMECSSLASAMENIPSITKPGDTVLLSPGGTSYDEFKNFEERGQAFSNLAKKHFS